MRTLIAAIVLTFGTTLAAAGADDPVFFRVIVKKDGRLTDSPSFLATVGQPVTLRLTDGLTVEALAKPVESDGGAWTQVRITYFETPDSKFVQEMSMHHPQGQRDGSFEYSDPSKRRFVIQVGGNP